MLPKGVNETTKCEMSTCFQHFYVLFRGSVAVVAIIHRMNKCLMVASNRIKSWPVISAGMYSGDTQLCKQIDD